MKVIKNLFYILKLCSKYNLKFLIVTILYGVYGISTVASVLVMKFTIDFVVEGRGATYIILFLLTFFGVWFLVTQIATFYNDKFLPEQSQKLKNSIKIELLKKVKNIDYSQFENTEFYDKYIRAIQEADGRAINVINSIKDFIRNLSSLAAILAVIVILDPVIIIISVVSLGLTMLVSLANNKLYYKQDTERLPLNRENDYINRVFYLQQYVKDNKLYSIKDIFLNRQNIVSGKILDNIKKFQFRRILLSMAQDIAGSFTLLSVLSYLAYRATTGMISIGDFAALINASQAFSGTLSNFFNIIPAMQKHSLYINDLKNFFEYKATIENDENHLELTSPMSIKLSNVNFSYNKAEFSLKNITAEIKNKQKIAIVGENGSGKTTLIKLLLRLYDVDSGEISYADHNIKDYNIQKLRNRCGVVFQDIQVFDTTIAEYILMREYKETDADIIWKALADINMYDYVKSLPKGIQTRISNEFDSEGIQLSGGQLQKLAIARVYAHDYDLIIMDEPSSALDPRSEYELNKKMLEIAEDKTVILISHRLSITKHVDCIFMIEKGEIIEKGNHDELMRKNGKYAELFNMQAESYYPVKSKDINIKAAV